MNQLNKKLRESSYIKVGTITDKLTKLLLNEKALYDGVKAPRSYHDAKLPPQIVEFS